MFEIRILREYDAVSYRLLRLKALHENPEFFGSSAEEEEARTLESFGERLKQDNATTYGAFNDGMLIGIVTIFKETRIKTAHIADIFGMYVENGFRGLGIGKALMTHAINEARTSGLTERLRLSVAASNTNAINLYLMLGFEAYGYEPNAIKIGQTYVSYILMNLDL